jgi:hypothetical protein
VEATVAPALPLVPQDRANRQQQQAQMLRLPLLLLPLHPR